MSVKEEERSWAAAVRRGVNRGTRALLTASLITGEHAAGEHSSPEHVLDLIEEALLIRLRLHTFKLLQLLKQLTLLIT